MTRFSFLPFLVSCVGLCIPDASNSQVDSQAVRPQSVQIAGHYFAAVPMVKGLPAFRPISRQLVSEQQFATLQFADTLGTVYICSGNTADGAHLYSLLHHRHDKGWTLTGLNFDTGNPDTLVATYSLAPLDGRQTAFPMDLRVVPAAGTLLFRWLLSPDDANIPGGVPIPANMRLDVGKPLFAFTVADLEGRTIQSSEFRGKVTVVDWWATTCSGCIEEIPGFNKLVDKYGPTVDFVAIAINPPHAVGTFLSIHKFLFRQTVAGDSMYQLIESGIPRTVVLDDQGVIQFDHVGGGPDSYKEFEPAIDSLLAQKQRGTLHK
jgi:thiol-disulfide isomerase/thioredoxin